MKHLLHLKISHSIRKDIEKLDTYITTNLSSNIKLTNQISSYIINSGGKRLRPLITLLAAKCCGYDGKKHIILAAIIEILHTATLLHDDVVDKSQVRRGKKTANVLWDNPEVILVGDFLYSRAFQLMNKLGNPYILNILADATNKISEGELLQLVNVNNTQLTEKLYIEIIKQKTATLFQAATQAGAVVADADKYQELALTNYGLNLGIAFQIIDDLLDYIGNSKDIGKKIGDDLVNNKLTLPLIYLLDQGTCKQKKIITDALQKKNSVVIRLLITELKSSGAIEYSTSKAIWYANLAKEQLSLIPKSQYTETMLALIDLAITRIN